MTFFEYPVTRPIPLSRGSLVLVILGALSFVAIVTVINVVAVGYELVAITTTDYNSSTPLWYEKFMPKSWTPQTKTCQPTVIKLNERSLPCCVELIKAVSTHDQLSYTLTSYIDARTGSPVEGITYDGSPLRNCSIWTMNLYQANIGTYPPLQRQVHICPSFENESRCFLHATPPNPNTLFSRDNLM